MPNTDTCIAIIASELTKIREALELTNVILIEIKNTIRVKGILR